MWAIPEVHRDFLFSSYELALSESHSSSLCLVWVRSCCFFFFWKGGLGGGGCSVELQGSDLEGSWVRTGSQRGHVSARGVSGLRCAAWAQGPTAAGSIQPLCRAPPGGGGSLYSWSPSEDLSLGGSDLLTAGTHKQTVWATGLVKKATVTGEAKSQTCTTGRLQ